jgi:hypothetical protein
LQAENFSDRRTFDKGAIAWIGLDLNPEVGSGRRDIQAALEFLGLKTMLHQFSDLVDLIDGHGQIEIQTYQGLDVGVDALAADHVEMNPTISEQCQ